jgi:hypothetical protein
MAAQRPQPQQGNIGISKPGHTEIAALGHGDQTAQHV